MRRQRYVCDGCGHVMADAKVGESLIKPAGTFFVGVELNVTPDYEDEVTFGIEGDACSIECARALLAKASAWLDAAGERART